ncbi:HEPN domain-containing protein [Desulfoscipio geothermicus]|uniref:HEPN domain-containing protein n=1 Tax=Desulfoscipio geothermicus DSM 3669 TaxID=1121426 RepID=A0A1I6DFV4_9FIRM|nr:HEPN domain-containing protein [Desulfoscipio geothermicus]SFR04309.1 HEPN domain-containing protein [Desulfoscipio geothermicus DSM 3669]
MTQDLFEWLTQAEYDLMTAKDMFNAGRYIYTVYMCHLAIEKALKALVNASTGKIPPKIHNLIRLMQLASAELTKEQKEFLATINTAAITTRYPEELKSALAKFNKVIAKDYLVKSEDVIKCIALDPKLKR